ncbi:unnamed protein product [Gemmata massiliana]|uniref:Uncharacterized protein n=1 Tax=Gemmata massiliana TaxID=1210884 RepID=A0A6P2CVF3_9BACT|nr:hypothetical protein [Gemmata massiliana]VTR92883.1 unnamed protein product [Gemmata massiliana]
MSIFSDGLKGFLGGFASAAAETLRHGAATAAGMEAVTRLCEAARIPIHARDDSSVALLFDDPVVGQRQLTITAGGTGKFAAFAVRSAANVSPEPDVLKYLLGRNTRLPLGAWQATNAPGPCRFALTYCAFIAGMDVSTFEYLCDVLLSEVLDFDTKLRDAGQI